jgi:hypothetical protein
MINMVVKVGEKEYNVPYETIKKIAINLDLSMNEAVEVYLSDNDIISNEEQEELDKKAKKVKIKHGAEAVDKTKKTKKPRTTKTSNEKKEVFKTILDSLKEKYENVEILNENKLILVKINEKTMKIDLVEQRQKKN